MARFIKIVNNISILACLTFSRVVYPLSWWCYSAHQWVRCPHVDHIWAGSVIWSGRFTINRFVFSISWANIKCILVPIPALTINTSLFRSTDYSPAFISADFIHTMFILLTVCWTSARSWLRNAVPMDTNESTLAFWGFTYIKTESSQTNLWISTVLRFFAKTNSIFSSTTLSLSNTYVTRIFASLTLVGIAPPCSIRE